MRIEARSISKPVVEVQIRAVAATVGGDLAVFLAIRTSFVILVDQSVGEAIAMFIQGTQKERPLTHELVANILRAFGAKTERVILNDFKAPLRHSMRCERSVIFER